MAEVEYARRALRRACLTVPGTSAAKLKKATELSVDEVIVDLQDSVAISEKNDQTRLQVVNALVANSWAAPILAVRVNGVRTAWFEDDVTAVVRAAGRAIAAIVLPMVESPDDVSAAAALLDRLEQEASIQAPLVLEAQIETARAIVAVDQIAGASPRLRTLVFGPGDFAASMHLPLASMGGIDPRYPGDQWAYPRSRIAVAAHAFGLDPIDGPYADFRDLDGLEESARRARALGFTGKWVIHPGQVKTCIQVFAPSGDELAAASRITEAMDSAASRGSGVAAVDGAMVDLASVRAAERVQSEGA